MNKFDQDLYEFVTKVENFEPAFEISNKFEIFKQKLIMDFWNKVEENLQHYNSELNGWEPLIGSKPWKLYLKHEEYITDQPEGSACTGYLNENGKIILGVSFVRTLVNYERVRKFAAQIVKEGWKLSPPNGWTFPIYKYMDEDFNNYDTLRKILPSEEDYLAKEYADILKSAHIELYPLIEKFGIKFK